VRPFNARSDRGGLVSGIFAKCRHTGVGARATLRAFPSPFARLSAAEKDFPAMKIAEALALRADLQKRLEQLKQRLLKNARIQEGDTPAEDPVELQAELEKSAQELIVLIQRINRTNAALRFGDRTMADALAERDVLKIRYNVYRELATAASTTQGRTTRSEVKFISTVSVAAIQRKADDLAREYRELDTRIQEADWLTTLSD
jgi:hypothetical protein